jgi:hypothetical protein
MVYVPIHAQQPSRRSRELAEQLRATIAGYQAREPKLSADEVRAALVSVTPGTRTTQATRVALAAAGVLGVLVAGIVAAAVQARSEGRAVPFVPIVIGVAAALAVVGVLVARARNAE